MNTCIFFMLTWTLKQTVGLNTFLDREALQSHWGMTVEQQTEKKYQWVREVERERKTGIVDYISPISDSPNSICPSVKCWMILLAGWFFGRTERERKREPDMRHMPCIGVLKNKTKDHRENVQHPFQGFTWLQICCLNNRTFQAISGFGPHQNIQIKPADWLMNFGKYSKLFGNVRLRTRMYFITTNKSEKSEGKNGKYKLLE